MYVWNNHKKQSSHVRFQVVAIVFICLLCSARNIVLSLITSPVYGWKPHLQKKQGKSWNHWALCWNVLELPAHTAYLGRDKMNWDDGEETSRGEWASGPLPSESVNMGTQPENYYGSWLLVIAERQLQLWGFTNDSGHVDLQCSGNSVSRETFLADVWTGPNAISLIKRLGVRIE